MFSAINGEELKKFVPELLEARYPGCSHEETSGVAGLPGLGWVLEHDGRVLVARASQVSHPFIWIRGGVAHAIPRSEALALSIAAGNKTLMVGRLYLAYGEDIAMVVFDEAISGANLSLDYQPSIEDAVTRFEMSLQYTAEWTTKVLEAFGGQRFSGDDWHLMSF